MIQMRYDEERGIYRDCKWCGGRGCLACPGEAEKEYHRQFPDGPKPIATYRLDDPNLPPLIKTILTQMKEANP